MVILIEISTNNWQTTKILQDITRGQPQKLPPPKLFLALDLELHPKKYFAFSREESEFYSSHTSVFILPLGGEHVKDGVYLQNALPQK